MRFAFTDDQLALRDAVRDLLVKECPPDVVRAAWPGGPGGAGTSGSGGSEAGKGAGARDGADRVAKVWADLAEMGVLGVAVDGGHGGLGLSAPDWILLAEETGYAALPHPFVETACVVAPLLAATADPDDVVADLVAGRLQAGVVVLDASTVAWDGRGRYVVLLRRRRGWEAVRIERQTFRAPGGQVEAVDGGRPVGLLGPWAGTGRFGGSAEAEAAFDRGVLGTAAQLVGLGRRMVDLTVAYVSERRQFGVPVGSQQAVKHHLADAAMGLRFAAPAVYAAAWSTATNQPAAGRDVSMAKALASDAARRAGRAALQCHGAIGYTAEYDLHLYLKRARSWGDAAWHRRRAKVLGL